MIVLGIDPGAQPGYAILHAPSGCAPSLAGVYTSYPQIGVPHVVVIERPEIRKGSRGRISLKSVVTLAFTAGQQLGEAKTNPLCQGFFAYTPTKWKNILYTGGIQVKKEVFCNRILADFPDDLSMLKLTLDQIDAIGIAWAHLILTKRVTK